jgi:hypothetical protein
MSKARLVLSPVFKRMVEDRVFSNIGFIVVPRSAFAWIRIEDTGEHAPNFSLHGYQVHSSTPLQSCDFTTLKSHLQEASNASKWTSICESYPI